MTNRRIRGRTGFFAIYLLATPLFLVIDLAFDMPFRIAALEGSNLRFAYYAGVPIRGQGDSLSFSRERDDHGVD